MKKVTIKDVAKVAGVSFSTVSRCLNDSPLVTEQTKRNVKRIAKEMGFEFNSIARSLITQKSHTVALVLPENFQSINVNAYHSRLINDIKGNLGESGLDLLLTDQMRKENGENNIIRLVTTCKVDGLLFLTEVVKKETLACINEWDFPAVFLHYPPESALLSYDCIYSNNRKGGELAADFLLSKGHRRFFVLGSEEYHLEFDLRVQGFLSRVGDAAVVMSCESDFHQAEAFVADNLKTFRTVDAVFCINDLMALGVMRALETADVRVPQDVSVCGYDDSEFCEYAMPSLTTLHQGREDIAFLAYQRLLARMAEERGRRVPPLQMSIDPSLVVRSST
jgi:LacI family transcriptional regulator